MGGMDLCDRLLSYFPIRTRTKTWTVKFLFHLVDLAIVNAWFQHREERSQNETIKKEVLESFEFRPEIGKRLLESTFRSNPNCDATPLLKSSRYSLQNRNQPLFLKGSAVSKIPTRCLKWLMFTLSFSHVAGP